MSVALESRARGALVGLAVGDALTWQALFHRSHAYPFWTRRLRREIDAASEDAGVLRPQVPFSLNQPTDAFAPGPTDDTEWAAFTMRALLDADDDGLAQVSLDAWRALAEGGDARGSVSTQAALANLRKGLGPPQSGHDNPHYFDDGACARAVPLGVRFAGEPERAASAARDEAQITNADVGVLAAQAVAAGVSVACGGGGVVDLVGAVRDQTSASGWLDRTVRQALDVADGARSGLDLVFALAADVVNREYNYGTSAPETLAVALAVTAYVGGDPERGVLGAAAVAKTADAAAPLAGAFCGALSGDAGLPRQPAAVPLAGLCVPALRGLDYLGLVEVWTARAARPSTSRS